MKANEIAETHVDVMHLAQRQMTELPKRSATYVREHFSGLDAALAVLDQPQALSIETGPKPIA